MKKNELRDQDKSKINEIDQDQIMNLLIIRMINYENKNKNKKFNNVFKAKTSENKNEFKSHKNKNKNKTKLKKSNEISMSTSDNVEKKNSHTLIVITVKDEINNYAFINILSMKKKMTKRY